MEQSEKAALRREPGIRRMAAERRRIAELTFERRASESTHEYWGITLITYTAFIGIQLLFGLRQPVPLEGTDIAILEDL